MHAYLFTHSNDYAYVVSAVDKYSHSDAHINSDSVYDYDGNAYKNDDAYNDWITNYDAHVHSYCFHDPLIDSN